MSGVVEWLPKTATEVLWRYADFSDELAPGETLTGASCAATVLTGNDGTPGIISGATVIANSYGLNTVAQVGVQFGVVGTVYQCVVTGTTSGGRTITKTAALAIKPPLT